MLQTPSSLPANSPCAHGSELEGGMRQEHSPSPRVERRCPTEHPGRGCTHCLPVTQPIFHHLHGPLSGQRGRAEKEGKLSGALDSLASAQLPRCHGFLEGLALQNRHRSDPDLPPPGPGAGPAPGLGSLPCPGEAACIWEPSMEVHGLCHVCLPCDV